MNIYLKRFSAILGVSLFTLGIAVAQDKEYDDLYFSSKDRVKVKKVKQDDRVVQNVKYVQEVATDPEESYSSKNVNPEYLARYQAKSQEDYSSDSEYSSAEYFDDEYADNNVNPNFVNNYRNNADIAVRDRYGNTTYFRDYSDVYWSDPSYYQGSPYDPFYSPYQRYSRYRPFRSGFSVSLGFGSSWGWRNSWNSGFSFGYGSYGGYGYGYDPFYSSYYNPFYCPPYYRGGFGSYYGYGYPYSNNIVVINNNSESSNRSFRRGPSTARNSRVVNTGRSRVNNSGDGITSGRSTTGGRVAAADSRDYSGTQNRYYRRSREAVTTQRTNNEPANGRTYNTGSRSSSNYSTESRPAARTRSYDQGNNNTTNRSGSNSRSYSTPSRSGSSGSYNQSGTRSRSSSGSSGSYNSRSSRSSGSSSSGYSSGSSSRSSGSSSGRSSSGSSSRSRRGGN